MDSIADALLNTCENNIKSLSQILTSLQSINALHRLKEKVDVIQGFSVIISFAPLLGPPAVPVPITATTVNESSLVARLERLERRAEILRRDRSAVLGEQQDEVSSGNYHTQDLLHPSTLEDGRDDDVSPPVSDLLHPVRKSDLTPFAPKEKPLYSFLLHFPIFSAVGATLASVDKALILSLPVMRKWGLKDAMIGSAYPRLRLTNGGTACIVVDDDLGRLGDIRKDLKEMEKEIWEKGASDTVLRRLFFVGTWNEEHVALVFSLSFAFIRGALGDFKRWTTPDVLWKDILKIYPVLSQYQGLGYGQEGGFNAPPLLGAALYYREQTWAQDESYYAHRLTLVVPFLGCPNALFFAHDFATQHPSIEIGLAGRRCRADVQVVTMGPPALKDDNNWAGPVLRNYKWLDGLHMEFGAKYNGPLTLY